MQHGIAVDDTLYSRQRFTYVSYDVFDIRYVNAAVVTTVAIIDIVNLKNTYCI